MFPYSSRRLYIPSFKNLFVTLQNSAVVGLGARITQPLVFALGSGSSVGIATGYGLDGPGFESRWGRDFRHLSRPAMGRPQSPVNGYRVFPGGKDQPRRDADPSPPSSVVVKKE